MLYIDYICYAKGVSTLNQLVYTFMGSVEKCTNCLVEAESTDLPYNNNNLFFRSDFCYFTRTKSNLYLQWEVIFFSKLTVQWHSIFIMMEAK